MTVARDGRPVGAVADRGHPQPGATSAGADHGGRRVSARPPPHLRRGRGHRGAGVDAPDHARPAGPLAARPGDPGDGRAGRHRALPQRQRPAARQHRGQHPQLRLAEPGDHRAHPAQLHHRAARGAGRRAARRPGHPARAPGGWPRVVLGLRQRRAGGPQPRPARAGRLLLHRLLGGRPSSSRRTPPCRCCATRSSGSSGVDRGVLDAARGMGMSPTAILFRVELPTAVPVIGAGVRTALVLAVGTVPARLRPRRRRPRAPAVQRHQDQPSRW